MEVKTLENKEEELTQLQINDLFRNIILGKDVTEKIKTSLGEFEVKFPRTRDIEEIGRRTALRLNGIPVRCFDVDTYNIMNYVATLDVLIVDGPDWYKLAKRDNPTFSWSDIPDQAFIEEVYALAFNFRQEVQAKIKPNKTGEDKQMAAVSDRNVNPQSGLFDGLSDSGGSN